MKRVHNHTNVCEREREREERGEERKKGRWERNGIYKQRRQKKRRKEMHIATFKESRNMKSHSHTRGEKGERADKQEHKRKNRQKKMQKHDNSTAKEKRKKEGDLL